MLNDKILNLKNTGMSLEEYNIIKPIIEDLNKGLNPIVEYNKIINSLNKEGKCIEYLKESTSNEFYDLFINIMRCVNGREEYNINFIKLGTYLNSIPVKDW